MVAFDVFLLYAPADAGWVEYNLLDELQRAGLTVNAQAGFQPGKPLLDEYNAALENSRYLLVVLSPAALLEPWVEFIRKSAMTQAILHNHWTLIPLVYLPVDLPNDLAALSVIDYTTPTKKEAEQVRLYRLLNVPPPPKRVRANCPYPGMRPFNSAEARYFFGRDTEIARMISLLRTNPFVAVIGPSGSGKSSVVMAGLVPKLAASLEFGATQWIIPPPVRPGKNPLNALGAVLGNPLPSVRELIARLGGTTSSNSNIPHRLLLIIDQLEELFTLAENDQVTFQNYLQELSAQPNVNIVATLRVDFLGIALDAPFGALIKTNPMLLDTLKQDGLRDAIRLPARANYVYVEEVLVERLVSDANITQEKGVLPLVQETLFQLWASVDGQILPLSAYEKMTEGSHSGLETAMARHADETMALMPSLAHQQMAKRILLNLVHPIAGRPAVKQSQLVQDLRRAATDTVLFDETKELLTQQRLILIARSTDESTERIDLAHEKLITGWPTLNQWVREYGNALETKRRLQDKAAEWKRLGGKEYGLLDLGELAEAKVWLNSPGAEILDPGEDVRALIKASNPGWNVKGSIRLVSLGIVALCFLGAIYWYSRSLLTLVQVGIWISVVVVLAVVLITSGFAVPRQAYRWQRWSQSAARTPWLLAPFIVFTLGAITLFFIPIPNNPINTAYCKTFYGASTGTGIARVAIKFPSGTLITQHEISTVFADAKMNPKMEPVFDWGDADYCASKFFVRLVLNVQENPLNVDEWFYEGQGSRQQNGGNPLVASSHYYDKPHCNALRKLVYDLLNQLGVDTHTVVVNDVDTFNAKFCRTVELNQQATAALEAAQMYPGQFDPDIQKAFDTINQAILAEPDYLDAVETRGVIYLIRFINTNQKSDAQQARADLDYVASKVKSTRYYDNLALICYAVDDRECAIQNEILAISTTPTFWQGNSTLANIYIWYGDCDSAAEKLTSLASPDKIPTATDSRTQFETRLAKNLAILPTCYQQWDKAISKLTVLTQQADAQQIYAEEIRYYLALSYTKQGILGNTELCNKWRDYFATFRSVPQGRYRVNAATRAERARQFQQQLGCSQ